MNLFVLDVNPQLAAQQLDDKRVGSALREANQMMSAAVHRAPQNRMVVGAGLGCRLTHADHPVTLWVGQTLGNFTWTYHYALALIDEWTLRYGTVHGSGERTPYIWTFKNCIPDGPLLPFQNSARNDGLGLDFTHLPVPQSYREYLKKRWSSDVRPPKFTNRLWPEWDRNH